VVTGDRVGAVDVGAHADDLDAGDGHHPDVDASGVVAVDPARVTAPVASWRFEGHGR
jgi:hypothetical protein